MKKSTVIFLVCQLVLILLLWICVVHKRLILELTIVHPVKVLPPTIHFDENDSIAPLQWDEHDTLFDKLKTGKYSEPMFDTTCFPIDHSHIPQ